MHSRVTSKAFTLIELLVVIAIIAILAAILFPVFAQAKMSAKKASDLSNVKQLSLGIVMYGGDYDDSYPFCWGWSTEWLPWHQQIHPYVKNESIWKSPVDNWDRGTENGGGIGCKTNIKARAVTYSMNFDYPEFGNETGNWWGSSSESCRMSVTCDDGSGVQTSVPSVASTIVIAPRPNWYHQWCQGWASEVFFNYNEFNMTGGGSKMFGDGTNYGFADGHAKYMVKGQTLKPLGSQVGAAKPSYWPTDANKWPWPLGMWDKRQ